MTWIDWVTVACLVSVAVLSALVAFRRQQRIRGDRELLRFQQRTQHNFDWVGLGLAVPGLVAPTGDSRIQAGDRVYWDGNLPGCVTKIPSGNNQAVAGVAVSDFQPVDPRVSTRPESDMSTELFVEFKRKNSWPYSMDEDVGEGCVREERVVEESDTHIRGGVRYYCLTVAHGHALDLKVQVREKTVK